MSEKILCLYDDALKFLINSSEKNHVLYGLKRGELGFIVAAPEMGKGYLALSMCYELATAYSFLNISNNDAPLRVLYWPIEDGAETVASRIHKHLQKLPAHIKDLIQQNMHIWQGINPIISKQNSHDLNELNELEEACLNYDVLVIDTLREAIGDCDEITDDIRVKNLLQSLATKTNTAIIATHHLTKAAARGLEVLSSVSGSGFSTTLANSRVQLGMYKEKAKKNEEETLYLLHLKANNIEQKNRHKKTALFWDETSLLTLENMDFQPPKRERKAQSSSAKIIEPKELIIDDTLFSEEPVLPNDMISAEDLEKYKNHLEKQKNHS